MSIKFRVLGGGGVFWVLEGGKCRFYFYGREDFSEERRVYANFFEKFARTFAFCPVTRVRNPTIIVKKNLFR